MTIDKIRYWHTIKVNNGSGVLLKPLSQEHLYIFTAYHVIDSVATGNIRCTFAPESEYTDQNIKVLDVVYNLEDDTAIIIIERNFEIDSFVSLCSLTKFEGDMSHVGFPAARVDGALSPVRVSYIRSYDGIIKNGFVEYEYQQPIRKNEIEGMSGGGIFTKDFRLVGIHTKSSCHDENEFLGKATYIPIAKYKNLIEENKLSAIVEFDLSSFASFLKFVFDLTNQRAVSICVSQLLTKINEYKYELYELSPIDLFERLKQLGRIATETQLDEFNSKYWTQFSEFLIGAMILLDIHKDSDDLITCIYDKFHYVYSRESFDVYDAREKLDLTLIKGMYGKSKLVIGGLDSNHYDWDVLPTHNKVPSLSHGLIIQDMDIAVSDRHILDNMTIINASLFKDTICERSKVISKSENQLEKYKQLLNDVINE